VCVIEKSVTIGVLAVLLMMIVSTCREDENLRGINKAAADSDVYKISE